MEPMCKIIFCIAGLLILILINKPHFDVLPYGNMKFVHCKVQSSEFRTALPPFSPFPLLTPNKKKRSKIMVG